VPSSAAELLAALESQVQNFDKVQPRVVITLYGDPGSGKTILAHQIAQAVTPPGKKIITLDTSDNILALREYANLRKNVVPIVYENLTQLGVLIGAMRSGKGSFADCGTLVVDEMSTVADSAILAVGKAREANGDTKVGIDALDQRDYGIARNQVAAIMSENSGIRSMKNVNIIMTAHARKDKDNTELVITSPAFPAKIALDVAKLSMLVGYCFTDIKKVGGKDVVERKVQVQDTVRIKAKSRIGGFNDPTVTGTQLLNRLVSFLEPKPLTESIAS
jgi:hypothetical protein